MMISDHVADFPTDEVHRHMFKACQVDHFRHWPASHRDKLRRLFLDKHPDGTLAEMTHWLIARSVDVSSYA